MRYSRLAASRSSSSHTRMGINTAIVAIALVISAGAAFTQISQASQASPSSHESLIAEMEAHGAFHICPDGTCSGYPDPSKVHGITIAALENWLIYNRSVRAQIRAARGWGANTIRLQILQDKLVGIKGNSFSPGYMLNIERIANFALKHHFDVVINAQTEVSTGFPWNENLPTHATASFWKRITSIYGKNPHVIFDLFNEPRWCSWNQWLGAFQPLVNVIRAEGSLNQFWVEGRWWGSTLQGVPLLHGQGIVYSFHHPGSPWPWQSPVGPSTWNSDFGYLASKGIPVVNGEFVNFMGGYYWPRSTRMVSEYLNYLSKHHIGTVAWSLQPGIMTATGDLSTAVSEPQGAGRLIWRYFHGQLPRYESVMTEHIPFRFPRGVK